MTKTSAITGTGATLGILFLINFLNFFDRVIPSVVLEPIRKEFGANDTEVGLMTTAFTLVYALVGVPLGRLADRHLRTRILSAGVFLWSLMTAASGMAGTFAMFVAARIGVGIGEASCAPAANSMIGDLYPAQKRASALGIFMLGLPLGSIAAFWGVGWLAQNYGWRAPFLIAAVPGVLMALLVLLLREPERGGQEAVAAKASAAPPDRPYRRILTVPTLIWIIVSGATYNFAAYAINTFLVAMLIRYHGLNLAQAGGIAGIVLGVTGLIALTAGASFADRLHQRHPRGRLLLGASATAIAAPLMWFGLGQDTGAVAALTVLCTAGWLLSFLYYPTVYASIQDVIEPRLRGTAMALYFFFMYVCGAAFGSTVAGALSDHYAGQAMLAAGATELTNTFRAVGLKGSLAVLIPASLALTGIALFFAAGTFVRDVAKAQKGAA